MSFQAKGYKIYFFGLPETSTLYDLQIAGLNDLAERKYITIVISRPPQAGQVEDGCYWGPK